MRSGISKEVAIIRFYRRCTTPRGKAPHALIISGICLTLLMSSLSYPLQVMAEEPDSVTVTIDPTAEQRRISPYIYGASMNMELSGLSPTALKQGGPRMSTYNWEENYSNAGSVSLFVNDNVLGQPPPNGISAQAASDLVTAAVSANAFSLLTLPMLGQVAADGNGPVLDEQTAPSDRWIPLELKKEDPLTLQPDTADNAVYLDEYINYLVQSYGNSSSRIQGYALDEQPTRWHITHRTARTEPVTCRELLEKSIATAHTVKRLDSHALIFGGQFFSLTEALTLGNASDWEEVQGDYSLFLDYYLSEMKNASEENGQRLLDVLDFHYFSEASAADSSCDTTVALCTNPAHTACNQARLQAVRTLWDTSYAENSRLTKEYSQFLPVLTTVQASINTWYPGTKLAMSSYSFGGGQHISGGLAQVDALGVFAQKDVFFACLSPTENNPVYQKAGLNLYTNYDQNGSSFGDMLVRAVSSDENIHSYAALRQENGSGLTVILTNLQEETSIDVQLQLQGNRHWESGTVYGFDAASPEISRRNDVVLTDNKGTLSLPPLTAVIVTLSEEGLPANTTRTASSSLLMESSATEDENSSAASITHAQTDHNTQTPEPVSTNSIEPIETQTEINSDISMENPDTDLQEALISNSSPFLSELITPPQKDPGGQLYPDQEKREMPIAGKVFTIVLSSLTGAGIVSLFLLDLRNKGPR